MVIRIIRIHAVTVLAVMFSIGFSVFAQNRSRRQPPNLNTAAYVAAEVTNGRLNPGESKRGDALTVSLREDLRSNGQMVLKKGATVMGMVRNVVAVENRSKEPRVPRSMVDIEWLVPAAGATSPQLVVTLGYVFQAAESSDGRSMTLPVAVSSFAAGTDTVSRANGRSNTALMRMPSVEPLEAEAARQLLNVFGIAVRDTPLFRVGRGALVSPDGVRHSLELLSFMSNETLLISESTDFEIAGSAQMQLLVGMSRK
jgi:hypothetical protein